MSLEHPVASIRRTAAAGHIPVFAVCCVSLEQILTSCSKYMAWVQDYPCKSAVVSATTGPTFSSSCCSEAKQNLPVM